MASDKPGSVQQDDSAFAELQESLLSLENLGRSSPELWPEKSMSEYMSNIFTPPNGNTAKVPYSKEFTPEDQNYLHQLASLSTAGLITKVKELHDLAYQLGLEESKEMTRGKYLNVFKRRNKK